ncbi:MAG: 3,4-dehydroadipyl-CoA semialdehyde dehydrogenase, partial [Myxococcales bacterium]
NAYAELSATLGDRRILADGEGIGIGRSARLFGQHVYVPREGVAVHVNAFNFPAWGLAEKLAVAFLAGMPVITKPATATALVAHRMMEMFVDSGALPEGTLSFVCGGTGDLLEHLGGQDVLAFTGGSSTGTMLRGLKNVLESSVHVNVEADSLNAAILGPDVEAGSELFNLFVADVVRDMTQKTGQKCTAIRRVFVPSARLAEVQEALVERLSAVRVGNPADEKVTMGPVSTAAQLRDVRAGIEKLAAGGKVLLGGPAPVNGLGAPEGKGYFVAPTLLLSTDPKPSDAVHAHEVFGPSATLIPFDATDAMLELVRAGGGGLVSSVYAEDKAFTADAVLGLAPYHGRVTFAGEKLVGQTLPPGMVLPQLLHGGPGRAGGGEELGGVRGMQLYMQRVALQGNRSTIEALLK